MTLQESNDQIISLIIAGKTIKEIAATLYLHKKTVEYRLRKMRERFKVTTTVQLIITLQQHKNLGKNLN